MAAGDGAGDAGGAGGLGGTLPGGGGSGRSGHAAESGAAGESAALVGTVPPAACVAAGIYAVLGDHGGVGSLVFGGGMGMVKAELEALPDRMHDLAVDERGKLFWVCGGKLGVHVCFVAGP